MKSLKNLLYVLKRFGTASALNLFGLSIAFASFIIIMMQVGYEKQFDGCHLNRDRVYRLEWDGDGEGFIAVVSRPLAYALQEASSHVKAMSLFSLNLSTQSVWVEDGQDVRCIKEIFTQVSPGFTEIFTFDWLEGDPKALTHPSTVVIPRSVAQKLYPNESCIGKNLINDDTTWVIGAVYKDLPKNSTIQNCIYYPVDRRNEDMNWGNANEHAYVMFDDPSSVDGFLEALVDHIETASYGYEDKEELRAKVHSVFRLNPLSDLYYSRDVKYVFSETGSRQTTFLLICIAFVVILIAAINFTNFTTALTPMRIKSLNTQKILGSTQWRLRWMIIQEGIFISLLSFLVALGLVYASKGTFVARLVASGISFSGNGSIILLAALISLLTGFLAGLYPAFYMTSFAPAMVLKGSFGLSMKGKRLRTVLLSVQYVASISLLVVSTFMMLQHRSMLRADFGFENQKILTVELGDKVLQNPESFADQLKQSTAIEEVAYCYAYLSCMDDAPSWGRTYRENHIQFSCFLVSIDMLKVLGVQVTEGRDFLPGDLAQESFIFNNLAKKQFGMELGNDPGLNIVGFMPDIICTSLRSPNTPMAFLLQQDVHNWSPLPLNLCYIRVKEGAGAQAVEHIGQTIKQLDSSYPFEIHPLDYHISETYRSEKNISSLITLFGVLSVLISVVGIYGLVVFETEYKRREIGVRKVFGSTTREVMQRFGKRYLMLILVCTAIAVPISYIFVDKWLTRFSTRVPVYWWVFVGAFLVIALITLGTTYWQNYRAASANPVDSLKAE